MQQILTYDITHLRNVALKQEFNVTWNDHNIILLSANYIIIITEYGAVEKHLVNANPTPRVHQLDKYRSKNNYSISDDLDKACKAVASGINLKRVKIAGKRHDNLKSLYHLKPVYTRSNVDTKKMRLEQQVRKAKEALNSYTHKSNPAIGSMARPYQPPKYIAMIGCTKLGTDKSSIMVWSHRQNDKGLTYFEMKRLNSVNELIRDVSVQFTSTQLGNLLSLLKPEYPLNNHNFNRIPLDVIKNGQLDKEIKQAKYHAAHPSYHHSSDNQSYNNYL